MNSGRLKPLKFLTKRQIRNRVSKNLLPYSYVERPFPESSESNNSSSDSSELPHSSSQGILREYATPVCDLNENEESVTASIQSDTEQDNNIEEQHYINNENETESLRPFLKAWATDYGVTQSQLKPLLAKLKEHECFSEQIPKDPRTLLGTSSTKTCVQTVKPGVYYHFGLKAGIEEVLSKNAHNRVSKINIKVGIDGVPISKSSKATFWPILATVEPFGEVFIVGVYFGYEKPTFAEDFLDEFLAETEDLCINGLNFRGEMLNCKIKCIIADAPAKAYIFNVKGHTGFHSCTKCKIRGKWKRHRVCFPNVRRRFPRRTDADLRHCRHRKHQEGRCCLRRIPNFDLVKNSPLDYMHLVCLGCMKKLLYLWVFIRSKCRLRKWEVRRISKRLCLMKKFVPHEFVRKPRSLNDLKFWKATEFRQFLLYTGPMVLRNILPLKMYHHFLSLHVAVRILCSDSFVQREVYLNYAEQLLSHFVQSLILIYSEHYASYNMHGLLHLVDDVRMFGKLDNFSAFEFENFMQYLKKWMRKGEKPLQQLVRRYLEFKANASKNVTVKQSGIQFIPLPEHHGGTLPDGCISLQYRAMFIEGFKLDVTKMSDKCFGLIDGEIVLINNIAHSANTKETVIIGREFKSIRDFYEIPCQSSLVDVYLVKNLSPIKTWPLSNVIKKFMIVSAIKNEYIVSALLHHL